MPRHKPVQRAHDTFARRAVASLAARLMAEEGIGDYGYAKRKAAKSLGLAEGETLPSNDEVEAELRIYQSLYQEDEQRDRLKEMRCAALDLMQLLDEFHPYLTGGVLDGTAGRYASVELDLFADSAKDVEISLLARNIAYDTFDPRRHGPDTPETQLRLEWEDVPMTLSIYPLNLERQQRRNPHSGSRPQRAKATAVAALLDPK
ncbi:MAG: hypothetical protein M0P39_02170 [Rhodocyclaceae bacterium]|jgi:hypothetical protein|nr:hypothetical protein [Rhodocyclaceae bacterium]